MRHHTILTLFGLTLGLVAIASGLFVGISAYFRTNEASMMQQTVADTSHTQPETEFFTFGDEAGQAIFLELINDQAALDPHYTLVAGSTASALIQENSPDFDLTCVAEGIALTSPSSEMMLNLKSTDAPGKLEQVKKAWFPFLEDSYVVTLWNPAGQPAEYTLAAYDSTRWGSRCLLQVDEDV